MTVGIPLDASQSTSFLAGTIANFALSAYCRLAAPEQPGLPARRLLFGKFLLVSLLALSLRSAALLMLTDNWQWQPQTAALAAILITTIVSLMGVVLYAFPRAEPTVPPPIALTVVATGIVAYSLILKLFYMGSVNLIPEEAYYWNYARHLDWSYLDHPPMVGWLIWLSTELLGKSEFSVRLPAYLCWLIAATLMFRLTVNLYDRPAAFRTLLLLAVLPIYFGLGFFMTPDAPLFAAWTGCLYFLERALIAKSRQAWWGVGLCMGVGMLSKYTIALLGLGTLTFLLIDRHSRRWLVRPEPYYAAILSITIFAPVLLWNSRNEWASFVFQGSNRWSGRHYFSLHLLIGWILLLLTPVGLLGIVQVFRPKRLGRAALAEAIPNERRQYLSAAVFTLLPLAVFVIYSLLNKPKPNWTAPVWLAALPLLAWDMVPHHSEGNGRWAQFGRRLWMPTIVALLFVHGGSFYYIARGLPGAGPMSGDRLFGEWRIFSASVNTIKQDLEKKTGAKPIVVGMDKNFISSELSFYDFADHDGPAIIAGSHLFGSASLMWAFWFPRSAAVGRNILMIDFNQKSLTYPFLPQYFAALSEVFKETIKKDGRVVGYFYWRVGYRYQG